MNILFITNLYPTTKNPDYGIFTKEQIDAVLDKGVNGFVYFINAKENGAKEYFKAMIFIYKNHKQYDIIHCFHGLSLIVSYLVTSKKKILVSFLNSIENESLLKNTFINSLYVSVYKYLSKKNRVYKIFKDNIPCNLQISKRSYYLPNGVSLSYFNEMSRTKACEALKIDPSYNFVLFVSSKNLNRVQKRYDIFLRVMNYLETNYKSYNFKPLILTNEPRERCVLYFNAASLHLMTSDFEGSPNSIKESMACNTPVVSTDVGNVRKMIEGIGNCFVSNSNEAEKLGELVINSLTSEKVDLRHELHKKNLSNEKKTEELIAIYKEILNGE